MPFLDLPLLKSLIEKIGGDGNKLFDFSHNDNRTQTIIIGDLSKANPEELKILQEIGKVVKPVIQSNQFELPAETSEKKLKEVETFASSSSKDEAYSFVSNNIPNEDKYIWLSALMLRQANYNHNWEKVRQIKEQMVLEHQQKGRNIANICNAGYLEEYIMPWYQHYVKDLNDNDSFLENYKSIVNNLLFIVFVGVGQEVKEIKTEIENKIQTLVNAHRDCLFIHAIGEANINKAEQIISEIKEEIPEIKDINKTTTNLTLKAEISL